MKLKDFYASYLIAIGVCVGHFAPGWRTWPILFVGLGGWVFYFEPKVCSGTESKA